MVRRFDVTVMYKTHGILERWRIRYCYGLAMKDCMMCVTVMRNITLPSGPNTPPLRIRSPKSRNMCR